MESVGEGGPRRLDQAQAGHGASFIIQEAPRVNAREGARVRPSRLLVARTIHRGWLAAWWHRREAGPLGRRAWRRARRVSWALLRTECGQYRHADAGNPAGVIVGGGGSVETSQWVNKYLDDLGPALLWLTGYGDRLRMRLPAGLR